MENHRHFNQLCDAAGDIEAVQAAIDNGVDVNDANYFGATGLMLALGTSVSPNMDVFLENFQTALTLRPFLEITLRFFPENL